MINAEEARRLTLENLKLSDVENAIQTACIAGDYSCEVSELSQPVIQYLQDVLGYNVEKVKKTKYDMRQEPYTVITHLIKWK